MFRSLLALTVLASAVVATPALAETKQCTAVISSLPVTLGTSGTYCLSQSLSTAITAGNAITITTDNVTLDCNGRTLSGTATRKTTRAVGVFAQNRSNLTVRHCDLRRFYNGVEILAGRGHLVEGNLFAGNSHSGASVQGDGAVVRDNRILDTGGSDTTLAPVGIAVQGNRAQVSGNQVSGVNTIVRSVIGISIIGAQATVESNFVQELEPNALNGGFAFGLSLSNGDAPIQAVVRRNAVLVRGDTAGGEFRMRGVPVALDAKAPGDQSFCEKNTLLGFDPVYYHYAPTGDCVDGGDNIAR